MASSLGLLKSKVTSLRILTYHDINDYNDDLYAVRKRQFLEHLSVLKDEGYTTHRALDLVPDLSSFLSKNKVVLLTFDDGYISNRDIAAELLTQQGMTATFFTISSMLGINRIRCNFSGKECQFLSRDDLRQMTLGGFEIGSHSHTHPMLGKISQEQVRTEMMFSKKILENAIDRDVLSFAYPFGRRDAFSMITRSVLENTGYSVAFSQEGCGITSESDLLRLPRTSIDRFDNPSTFLRKLQGYYDVIGKDRCEK
jgi:peptidoglycan/xylan/chitin deacetylase (PgdA/CDA1 family)